MRLAGQLLALGAFAMLASCGVKESVDDASRQIGLFHSQLDGQEFDQIWASASPELHGAAKAEDFQKLLAAVHRKLGNVKQSSQVGWNENATTGGTFVALRMNTTFEKGTGQESFTYVKHDGNLQLAGYFITSNDMMTN